MEQGSEQQDSLTQMEAEVLENFQKLMTNKPVVQLVELQEADIGDQSRWKHSLVIRVLSEVKARPAGLKEWISKMWSPKVPTAKYPTQQHRRAVAIAKRPSFFPPVPFKTSTPTSPVEVSAIGRVVAAAKETRTKKRQEPAPEPLPPVNLPVLAEFEAFIAKTAKRASAQVPPSPAKGGRVKQVVKRFRKGPKESVPPEKIVLPKHQSSRLLAQTRKEEADDTSSSVEEISGIPPSPSISSHTTEHISSEALSETTIWSPSKDQGFEATEGLISQTHQVETVQSAMASPAHAERMEIAHVPTERDMDFEISASMPVSSSEEAEVVFAEDVELEETSMVPTVITSTEVITFSDIKTMELLAPELAGIVATSEHGGVDLGTSSPSQQISSEPITLAGPSAFIVALPAAKLTESDLPPAISSIVAITSAPSITEPSSSSVPSSSRQTVMNWTLVDESVHIAIPSIPVGSGIQGVDVLGANIKLLQQIIRRQPSLSYDLLHQQIESMTTWIHLAGASLDEWLPIAYTALKFFKRQEYIHLVIQDRRQALSFQRHEYNLQMQPVSLQISQQQAEIAGFEQKEGLLVENIQRLENELAAAKAELETLRNSLHRCQDDLLVSQGLLESLSSEVSKLQTEEEALSELHTQVGEGLPLLSILLEDP